MKLNLSKVKTEIETGSTLLQSDGTCIFLSGSLCLIHPVKPEVCRTYPMMPDEGKTLLKIHVDTDCPRGAEVARELKEGRYPSWLEMPKSKKVMVIDRSFLEITLRDYFGEES